MPTSTGRASAGARGGVALWAALGTIYVVWGSTYFGIAVGIETIPPFIMAAIRFVVAGALLLAVDLARHPEARRWPTRRELLDSLIVGGLLLAVGNGFVGLGERTVPSGIAAILIGMMPLWFAIFGWLYFRDVLPRLVAAAVVIGFAGVALLVWPEGGGANHFDPLGMFVLFLAPIGWGHGSLYSARKAKLPRSPLTASALQMLFAVPLLLLESVVVGEPATFHPEQVSLASMAAVAYLVVFGSMLAFTAYGWLLRNAPISLVGTYAYVNPVVAVFLGTAFLGETLSTRTLIASAVILVAVAIIVTARGRMSQPARREVKPVLVPDPAPRTERAA